MNFEDYYGDENYVKMKEALECLVKLTESWKSESSGSEDLQSVVYCCYRIKRP